MMKRSNSLSSKQHISLIIVGFLRDPYLVRYFLDILSNVELEDAREFHQSLREISAVNSAVPVGFTIPICNRMWRTHVELFKYISYTRQGFIQREDDNYDYMQVDKLSLKIKVLNQVKRLNELRRMNEITITLKAVQCAFNIFSRIMDSEQPDVETDIDMWDIPDSSIRKISFICLESNGSISIVGD